MASAPPESSPDSPPREEEEIDVERVDSDGAASDRDSVESI